MTTKPKRPQKELTKKKDFGILTAEKQTITHRKACYDENLRFVQK